MTPQRNIDARPGVDSTWTLVRTTAWSCRGSRPPVRRDLPGRPARTGSAARAHRLRARRRRRLGSANLAALSVFARALEQAGGCPAARRRPHPGPGRPGGPALVADGPADRRRRVRRARARQVRAAAGGGTGLLERATVDRDAGRIRHEAVDCFRRCGLAEDVILDALVVVNELAANVVDHARTCLGGARRSMPRCRPSWRATNPPLCRSCGHPTRAPAEAVAWTRSTPWPFGGVGDRTATGRRSGRSSRPAADLLLELAHLRPSVAGEVQVDDLRGSAMTSLSRGIADAKRSVLTCASPASCDSNSSTSTTGWSSGRW